MYCPKCGANQSDEMKFCNLCGANLSAVRQVVESREVGEKFDWNKTWMAEIFLSDQERKKRKSEMEHQRGITPEVKRSNEIKGGIITSFAGVGLMVFLYVFMQGIIKSGVVPEHVAEILRHVWIAGVIPFFVGIGVTLSGVVVGKKLVQGAEQRELPNAVDALDSDTPRSLRPANTTEFATPEFSITEGTTKHLRSSSQKQ